MVAHSTVLTELDTMLDSSEAVAAPRFREFATGEPNCWDYKREIRHKLDATRGQTTVDGMHHYLVYKTPERWADRKWYGLRGEDPKYVHLDAGGAPYTFSKQEWKDGHAGWEVRPGDALVIRESRKADADIEWSTDDDDYDDEEGIGEAGEKDKYYVLSGVCDVARKADLKHKTGERQGVDRLLDTYLPADRSIHASDVLRLGDGAIWRNGISTDVLEMPKAESTLGMLWGWTKGAASWLNPLTYGGGSGGSETAEGTGKRTRRIEDSWGRRRPGLSIVNFPRPPPNHPDPVLAPSSTVGPRWGPNLSAGHGQDYSRLPGGGDGFAGYPVPPHSLGQSTRPPPPWPAGPMRTTGSRQSEMSEHPLGMPGPFDRHAYFNQGTQPHVPAAGYRQGPSTQYASARGYGQTIGAPSQVPVSEMMSSAPSARVDERLRGHRGYRAPPQSVGQAGTLRAYRQPHPHDRAEPLRQSDEIGPPEEEDDDLGYSAEESEDDLPTAPSPRPSVNSSKRTSGHPYERDTRGSSHSSSESADTPPSRERSPPTSKRVSFEPPEGRDRRSGGGTGHSRQRQAKYSRQSRDEDGGYRDTRRDPRQTSGRDSRYASVDSRSRPMAQVQSEEHPLMSSSSRMSRRHGRDDEEYGGDSEPEDERHSGYEIDDDIVEDEEWLDEDGRW